MDKKIDPPVLILVNKGPIRVSGNFSVNSENNETISSGSVVYLCRCGKSLRKPFCDGSHKGSCD